MTGTGSSCGACKFLRRRCSKDCVFAPFFCYEEAASHFEAVHRVFGASNVSKLLLHLPMQDRREAAITVSFEALARMQDPVYGCVSHIFALQQQVACLKQEIEQIGNQIATFSEPAFSSYDMIQENYMNEHTDQLLGLTGTVEQFPQTNSWESADISHSQTLFAQEFHQTVDQQYLWTDNCSNVSSFNYDLGIHS